MLDVLFYLSLALAVVAGLVALKLERERRRLERSGFWERRPGHDMTPAEAADLLAALGKTEAKP